MARQNWTITRTQLKLVRAINLNAALQITNDARFNQNFGQLLLNTFNRCNALQALASDIFQSNLRGILSTFFNNPVEIFKSTAYQASFVEVESYFFKTRLKGLNLHKITSQNKIFEDFGFAQPSIPLGHLRIFIEESDFVDT